MRLMIYFNDAMSMALLKLCSQERRLPRQQAETLLEQALLRPCTLCPRCQTIATQAAHRALREAQGGCDE